MTTPAATPATAAAMPVRPQQAPGLGRGAQNSPAAMQRAAQNFEAQALAALLQPMFEGLRTDGPTGGGSGEAQWRPMMLEHMARGIANAGGLGIAASVYREMLRSSGQMPGYRRAGAEAPAADPAP